LIQNRVPLRNADSKIRSQDSIISHFCFSAAPRRLLQQNRPKPVATPFQTPGQTGGLSIELSAGRAEVSLGHDRAFPHGALPHAALKVRYSFLGRAPMGMAGRVFINYRRDDSMSTAGRLHDRLAQAFGRKNIFMDVDHIPPGVDFVNHLNAQVAACDVFLTIIGPNWLAAKDDSGHRRIDNPDDFVTVEIAAALARDIRVIPVMVDGAHLPKAGDLPENLKPLLRRHAVEVRNTQFGRDAEALVQKLREAFKSERTAPRRWLAVTASAVALLLAIGLYQMGVPVWMPWTSGAVQPGTGSAESAKSDADANRVAEAKAAADAEAKRRADEVEQQRQAAKTYSKVGNFACFSEAEYPDSWREEASLCAPYGCNFGKLSQDVCLTLGVKKRSKTVIHGNTGTTRANECWLQHSCRDLRPHSEFTLFRM
jgi:hypothetical protein